MTVRWQVLPPVACAVVGLALVTIAAESVLISLAILAVAAGIAVCYARPAVTVHLFLLTTFTALPSAIPETVAVGGVSISLYEPFMILSLLHLLRHTQAWDLYSKNIRRTMGLAIVLALTVLYGVGRGILASNSIGDVARDARPLLTMLLALAIGIELGRTSGTLAHWRTLLVSLLLSSVVTVGASIFNFGLQGRSEAAQLYSTAGGVLGAGADATAVRYLTPATTLATMVMAVLVASVLVGRRLMTIEYAGLVACVILALLSFSRFQLFGLAAAASASFIFVVAKAGALGVARWAGRLLLIATAVVLLLQLGLGSASPNSYIGRQAEAFESRVLAGLDPRVQAQDTSAQDRVEEDFYLAEAIAENPVFGTGLGYRYKPASGKVGSFAADDGRLYAHNFYDWYWMKAGPFGLMSFLIIMFFALWGLLRRAPRDPMTLGSLAALLAAGMTMFVSPLPITAPNCILVGGIIGFALTISVRSGRFSQLVVGSAERAPSDIRHRYVVSCDPLAPERRRYQ